MLTTINLKNFPIDQESLDKQPYMIKIQPDGDCLFGSILRGLLGLQYTDGYIPCGENIKNAREFYSNRKEPTEILGEKSLIDNEFHITASKNFRHYIYDSILNFIEKADDVSLYDLFNETTILSLENDGFVLKLNSNFLIRPQLLEYYTRFRNSSDYGGATELKFISFIYNVNIYRYVINSKTIDRQPMSAVVNSDKYILIHHQQGVHYNFIDGPLFFDKEGYIENENGLSIKQIFDSNLNTTRRNLEELNSPLQSTREKVCSYAASINLPSPPVEWSPRIIPKLDFTNVLKSIEAERKTSLDELINNYNKVISKFTENEQKLIIEKIKDAKLNGKIKDNIKNVVEIDQLELHGKFTELNMEIDSLSNVVNEYLINIENRKKVVDEESDNFRIINNEKAIISKFIENIQNIKHIFSNGTTLSINILYKLQDGINKRISNSPSNEGALIRDFLQFPNI